MCCPQAERSALLRGHGCPLMPGMFSLLEGVSQVLVPCEISGLNPGQFHTRSTPVIHPPIAHAPLRLETLLSAVLVREGWGICCQTSGVSATAGASKRSPPRALTAMACWTVQAAASTPISSVPRGVAAPMQTLRRPIILPRIAGGVTSMVMVLCIVLERLAVVCTVPTCRSLARPEAYWQNTVH
jgi:hypothetical protein